MLLYPLKGVALGLSAAASPGPFQAYLLSQSMAAGWRRTWPAAFAPLLSDGPVIALVVLVLAQVPPAFLRVLQVAGGVFLLYLAIGAIQRVRVNAPASMSASAPASAQRGLLKATLTNLLGPGPYLFWSTVGGPTLVEAWAQSPAFSVAFLLGFYGATVIALLAFIGLFTASARIGPAFTRILGAASALALVGFGVYQIVSGLLG